MASNSYQLRSSVFLVRLRGMPQRGARALPPPASVGKPDDPRRARPRGARPACRVPSERAADCMALLRPRLLRLRTGGAGTALGLRLRFRLWLLLRVLETTFVYFGDYHLISTAIVLILADLDPGTHLFMILVFIYLLPCDD